MSILTIPVQDIKTTDDFTNALPDYEVLDMWQQVQYDEMLRMWEVQKDVDGSYNWTSGHDGVLEDFEFRDARILKAHANNYTFCSGASLFHFLSCYKEYVNNEWESELDMTLEMAKELKAYFFVYKDYERYYDGAPAGLAELDRHLSDRWFEVYPDAEKSEFRDSFGLDFRRTTNIEEARFGDYIQLQNKPDPIGSGSGHAAIFVGLEERSYRGEDVYAVRVFQSNLRNDYGMPPGIGLAWWIAGKVDKSTGFERIFKLGGFRENDR